MDTTRKEDGKYSYLMHYAAFVVIAAGLLAGGCAERPLGQGASAGSSGGARSEGEAGARPEGGAGAAGAGGGGGGGSDGGMPRFSFFVTSIQAMRDLSGSQDGFGGDLRFGEVGEGAGLRGADKICTAVAERSMPGSGVKPWRAFLSTTAGPVHAIDRVGDGPWYDRLGRLVAPNKADLARTRPVGGDPEIADDLPNEHGIPNHHDGAPDCRGNACPDNHDVLTGTGPSGMLYMNDPQYTCDDWTSSMMSGRPWCGNSWPHVTASRGKTGWMSELWEGGCAPGVNLMEMGGPNPSVRTVGTGGGYGAIYCFALVP